jgi:hypothetical protein
MTGLDSISLHKITKMKKSLSILILILFVSSRVAAQTEPNAGNWKTWFIPSGKSYRLPAPTSYRDEIPEVMMRQKELDSAGLQRIMYWNAGAPGYHWQEMMTKLWQTDTSVGGAIANMLMNVSIYDATIAAWDTKYAYKTPRPFAADKHIKSFAVKPESPSYPCEYSVAAGAAVCIISHFFPLMADSVQHMAEQLMATRVAAGMAFPGDTKAGYALGKKIAEAEILSTKNFAPEMAWDHNIPKGPAYWNGKQPMFPMGGHIKTITLDSSSQFRPAPPPDFSKDMAELKSFKQNFRSMANALYWASQDFWGDVLNKKMFEQNIHLDPPRAARIYAVTAIGTMDLFAACWDAKYAYWGIRPDQYDTSYHSLIPTPPFPGYPSGHAAMSGMMATLYSYFFPADRAFFQKKAKDAAESRFQAGIHFRTDNEVGLELGKKVGAAVIAKAKLDGSDGAPPAETAKKNEQAVSQKTKAAVSY